MGPWNVWDAFLRAIKIYRTVSCGQLGCVSLSPVGRCDVSDFPVGSLSVSVSCG